MKRLFSLVASLALFSAVRAQTTYLNDDFSYNAGNIAGQGSWLQVGTTNINPIQVLNPAAQATPALTYSGYSATGGTAVAAGTSGQNVFKNFNAVATSGTVYSSFLLRVSAAQSSGNVFLGLTNVQPANTNFNYALVYARSSGPGFQLGIAKNRFAPALYAAGTYTFNTTYLVVLKYAINPNGTNDDSVSLYVFSSGVPATEPATPTVGPAGYANQQSDADSLTSLMIRQTAAQSSPTFQMDALRVTSAWMSGTALPAAVLSFNAVARSGAAELRWTTGSESNVAAFEVEKSRNGADYIRLCRVAPHPTGAGTGYVAVDASLATGTSYYRLKTTDLDGSYQYSAVATVRSAAAPGVVTVHPNPVGDGQAIATHPVAGAARIWLVDGTGKTVRSAAPIPGSTQTPIPMDGLPTGFYHAVYQDGLLRQPVSVQKN